MSNKSDLEVPQMLPEHWHRQAARDRRPKWVNALIVAGVAVFFAGAALSFVAGMIGH